MQHTLHAKSSLPITTLSWLSLTDHFVATVGENAGRGRPLGPLRVLVDAVFAPHSRFQMHRHDEMEILSVVVSGTLSHHGDQAHGTALMARSAQLISSRDGMFHAEGNDTDAPCQMLQIWITPDTRGGAPAYFGKEFFAKGRHCIAGEPDMPLRADVKVYFIDVMSQTTLDNQSGRATYLLALDNDIDVDGVLLHKGDGMTVTGDGTVTLKGDGSVVAIDLKL